LKSWKGDDKLISPKKWKRLRYGEINFGGRQGSICQSHVEYAIGLEFMRQMIVFHLRNSSKKALKGIVVKAQNG
jgi:hypothetical protein